jgi:putative holliday junction resolvase
MGKLLGIDYGLRRVGLAITDDLKIIASPLITVDNREIIDFLKDLTKKESIEKFILGEPKTLQNNPGRIHEEVMTFQEKLKKHFPNIPVVLIDERFSSKIAYQSIQSVNFTRKKKQDKTMLDKVSASIILQSYLSSNQI